MTQENKVVSLHEQTGLYMSGDKPTFYTVRELILRYPTIHERGWTEDDLELFAVKMLYIAQWPDANPAQVQIEKQSFEDFLEFHNSFLRNLNRRVREGVEEFKKKPVPKK